MRPARQHPSGPARGSRAGQVRSWQPLEPGRRPGERQKNTARGRRPGLPAAARWVVHAMSTLAPGPAAELARRIFLRPPRFRAPTRELWWETEAEELTIPFPGSADDRQRAGSSTAGELSAWRWGSSGPTIVLVHGWGGRALQLGAFAQPLVDAGFRVLAVDLPAHGRSAGTSTSLPQAADAVGAVLRHAAAEAGGLYGVVAHSFGCAALAVALAGAASEGDGGAQMTTGGVASPRRVVFLAPPSDLDQVTRRFAELTGFRPEIMTRLLRDLERRFAFRWEDLQPRRLVPRLESPLLVVHDTADEETSWTEGQALADLAADGRLHLTAGLGHYRLLRDASVLEQVAAFFAADPGARRAA